MKTREDNTQKLSDEAKSIINSLLGYEKFGKEEISYVYHSKLGVGNQLRITNTKGWYLVIQMMIIAFDIAFKLSKPKVKRSEEDINNDITRLSEEFNEVKESLKKVRKKLEKYEKYADGKDQKRRDKYNEYLSLIHI